ncbi:MAG: hypothetical protein HY319_00165, partial [Armatimonadetes bacterium]|nr:hypothetical protein [Armatimonadota bacterium]
MFVSPRLAPAVIGLLLALLYGCGGPLQTVETANPTHAGPSLGLTFEPAAAATARLGPAGGGLEATGSDGTRYTLTIPPGALLEEVDITLTPVAVAGLPVSGRTLGAVHFAPEGLRLLTPATLTVRPVLPVDARRFVAVGFHGEGTQLFVAPARTDAQELVISVLHFSGAAAAEATPQETQALGNLPQSSASQAAQNQIGVTLAQSVQDTGSFSEEAIGHCEQVLRDYFEASVIGPLQQAASDQALEAALGEFAFWKGLVSHTEFLAGSARQLNEAEERRGAEAARAGLQAAVRRVNDRIEQTGDWRVADEMLRWNGYAQAFGLDTPADGLDLVTIVRDLAVQIDLGPITFPSSLDNTDSARLEATAGLKIRNRATSYADPVAISISLQGSDPAAGAGDTDSQGQFALEPIRLSAGSTAIDARVEARFPRLSLPLFAVKTAHCDGVVDLDFTGPGDLQLGGTGTYIAVVRKGLGVAMGSWVTFSQQGPGSLNPTSARTSNLGLVQTAFQAPMNAGQTELTL